MNILITGVSGSGKTTLAAELIKRGYDARNMDSIKDLCSWVDLATGKAVPDKRETQPDWLEKHDWMWSKNKLVQLLEETDDTFFCGSSGNQGEFYSLFDKVILLEMNADLIKERILNSNRDHSYGRMPGELEAILGYYKDFQDKAIAFGAVVIDAGKPLPEIIGIILSESGVKLR